MSTTRLSRRLHASRESVYRALTDPAAVAAWMFPDGMRLQVHQFEPRVGGRFRLSLTYEGAVGAGKTSARTDTYGGRFVDLVLNERVAEVLAFETADPALQGEMVITFILYDVEGATELTAVHQNVPRGLSPADNELGWQMALEKLALFLREA
jgi:uncharacterized protein YndB with AHSA1/START domain